MILLARVTGWGLGELLDLTPGELDAWAEAAGDAAEMKG